MSTKLIDLLVKERLLNEEQQKELADVQKANKDTSKYIIEKKFIPETKLLYIVSQKFGIPSFNLREHEIPEVIHKLVHPEMVKKTGLIPVQMKGNTLVVAFWDPQALDHLETIKLKTQKHIDPILTVYSAFDETFRKYYSGAAIVGSAIENFKKEQRGSEPDAAPVEQVTMYNIDEEVAGNDAPIIQLCNALFNEGIKKGASDIHVEPYEKSFRVRIRVDGALIEMANIPVEMRRSIVSRLKIMSSLDISETRVPQDGRIKIIAGNKEIDYRVNCMPTLFGEKVCMRMLSKGNLTLDLTKLGFEEGQLKRFRKGIYAPNGMVLVTGPTGSGKTTTLYSALSELNQITDNISTAEDPVEYNLEGVNQVQVRKDVGLTFASVLRALLRQDPDTILVGEIRDLETAETAIQAALTGHLVLSTLHTNDAPSTITRLINMGVEEFLVVSALNTVVAQRLLRKVCTNCKAPENEAKIELAKFGVPQEILNRITPLKGTGCAICNNSGYKGRIAIYEVLDMSEVIKEMVLKKATIVDIRRTAIKEGMKTLRLSALTKVLEGSTSLEEALSATSEG
jgi:type IV pilus assembly protein PilB